MAEKEKDKEKEGGEGEAKKGGKKKLIIIIVGVLLLVGIGVGAFLVLGKSGKTEEGEEGADTEEAAGAEEGGELPGAIMPLETFIVNLQVKGSFLKVTINLEFAEPELPHSADTDMPKIRDAIIRVLSKKEAKDILAPEGKDKVRDEIKEIVNQTLGSEDVVGVYFTEFIVQ